MNDNKLYVNPLVQVIRCDDADKINATLARVQAALETRNKVELFKVLLASEDITKAPLTDSDRWKILEVANRMYEHIAR